MDLLDFQFCNINFVDKPLVGLEDEYPLDLYCDYTFDQILVALGKHTEQKKSSFREGVLYLAEKKLDVFFVTLNKSSRKKTILRPPCIRIIPSMKSYFIGSRKA